MAKKNRKARVANLADFRKKAEEEYSIVIETPDGKRYRYRGPQLLGDDEMRQLLDLQASDDPRANLEAARLMLDDYDGFVDSGGSMGLLQEIVQAQGILDEDDDGATPGESEASSGS